MIIMKVILSFVCLTLKLLARYLFKAHPTILQGCSQKIFQVGVVLIFFCMKAKFLIVLFKPLANWKRIPSRGCFNTPWIRHWCSTCLFSIQTNKNSKKSSSSNRIFFIWFHKIDRQWRLTSHRNILGKFRCLFPHVFAS